MLEAKDSHLKHMRLNSTPVTAEHVAPWRRTQQIFIQKKGKQTKPQFFFKMNFSIYNFSRVILGSPDWP